MSEAAERVMERVSRADRNGALELASQAFAGGDRHPLIVMLAAETIEATDPARAIQMLRAVTAEQPDEPEPWRRLGVLLARTGQHEEARAALEEADDIWPDQPWIVEPLGGTCLALADLAAADFHFARLEALLPGKAAPLAARAAVAVRRGDHAAARDYSNRAITAEPGNAVAALARARVALETGDAADAVARASALLDQAGAEGDAAVGILGLRADARDAAGDPTGAFADYLARNELVRRRTGPLLAQQKLERRVDQVRRLRRDVVQGAVIAPVALTHREPAAPAAHMFVLGFPRSGTTLLEKALAGHDAIRTLPEIDCLARVAGGLLEKAGADRPAKLSEADIAGLRRAYFELVAVEVGPLPGTVLVDKLPLHSVALPLIARLFPDATLVLSLRDPRDVILSCLRRRFQMNAAMFELLRPADAINYYEAVMELVEACRTHLPVTLHEVRHEALVADLEGEVRRLLALVGLEWQPAIADFAGRAAARARTPSDIQLTRGLNAEGVGQWQRYAEPLAPWLPRLRRWVTRWGYDATA